MDLYQLTQQQLGDCAVQALKADGTLKRLNDKYFASAATASDNHQ